MENKWRHLSIAISNSVAIMSFCLLAFGLGKWWLSLLAMLFMSYEKVDRRN